MKKIPSNVISIYNPLTYSKSGEEDLVTKETTVKEKQDKIVLIFSPSR